MAASMDPRRRVVVGVSDTPASGPTLIWAIAEAVESRRHLVIVHGCRSDSPLAGPAATLTARLELFHPELAQAVAAARLRLGGDRVDLIVRTEPPADLLVDLARPDDVLVVGAPPQVGWPRRASLTRHVLRYARCPVVVVRPRPVSGPHVAFDGSIVVGVDGSPAARAALEFAFAYADDHRRTLVAATITPHIDTDLWYDDQFLEAHLTEHIPALELLAAEVEPWERKYPGVRVRRAVLAGSPVDGLLRAAHGAAILVVGDGGGHALRRALVGTTSEAAIDRAECPVAVVPATAADLREARVMSI